MYARYAFAILTAMSSLMKNRRKKLRRPFSAVGPLQQPRLCLC